MTGSGADDGGSQLDQSHGPTATMTVGRPAWIVFIAVAAAVLVVDQLTKAWIVAAIVPGSTVRIVGDLLRLIHSKNDGALFGLFGSAAPVFALASLVVIGLILWFHARSDRNVLLSLALGLLLGGALGNLIDRVRLGYVVDWVDAGIGTIRFWTFNVGDAAISLAILLLLLIALRPGLAGAAADG